MVSEQWAHKGTGCLILRFNCVVKIKQREARDKCGRKTNTGGLARRRSLKKKRNGKGSKRTESGSARKNKTRPNEGEPSEKERLRKKKRQKEG